MSDNLTARDIAALAAGSPCHHLCMDSSEIITELAGRLAAVTAGRDRLRSAAEIGLVYVKSELERCKESFAGYPTCWIEEQRDVAFIDAALRGEVQGE